MLSETQIRILVKEEYGITSGKIKQLHGNVDKNYNCKNKQLKTNMFFASLQKQTIWKLCLIKSALIFVHESITFRIASC